MKGMLHPPPARVDAGQGARALATENSFRTGILSVMLLACGLFLSGASEPASAAAIAPPAAAAPPDDGQWTMPAKNYASTRFSELSEINEGNVRNLQVAFTFSTGVNKGQE
ncbi:PQQ-dependent dehydrogenase, methanol/ethanol family, partial [Mesorhizobium sp. M7A.F.Ca.CA.001.06.1.1]